MTRCIDIWLRVLLHLPLGALLWIWLGAVLGGSWEAVGGSFSSTFTCSSQGMSCVVVESVSTLGTGGGSRSEASDLIVLVMHWDGIQDDSSSVRMVFVVGAGVLC